MNLFLYKYDRNYHRYYDVIIQIKKDDYYGF